jgi:drug/metabolite transporter (DMT)-like permease
MLLHLDKHYNTPFLNNLMLRGFSLILLLCVSIFIFNEEYSSLHTMGIILATLGIMILVMNPVKSKV